MIESAILADFDRQRSGSASVVTKRLSLTPTVPGPGNVRVTFAGDDTYAAAVGLTAVRVGKHLPGRVQLDPLPAMVEPNVDFTISGQAQEETPDGSWVPASWA